ncbi:MAG: hypothetical protein KKI16_12980, partial [Alphaproteobacteria bacterium]|nr:hypothetical protein [Alphaproteobacteria bacterium]
TKTSPSTPCADATPATHIAASDVPHKPKFRDCPDRTAVAVWRNDRISYPRSNISNRNPKWHFERCGWLEEGKARWLAEAVPIR